LRVSIAMCTHNGELFLEEQLKSFEAQTVLPNELVIVDDQSADSTPDIVRRFAKNASFSVLFSINPTRLGITKNFELASSKCSGEYIFLSDQDDTWVPIKVQTFLELFECSIKTQLLHSNANLVDFNGKSTGATLFDTLSMPSIMLTRNENGCSAAAFNELLKRNLVTGATVAFRRELLLKALPFCDSWLHDEWLGMIAAANNALACIDIRLIDYRQHENNSIGAYGRGLLEYLQLIKSSQLTNYKLSTLKFGDMLERLKFGGNSSDLLNVEELARKVEFTVAREKYPQPYYGRIFPIIRNILRANYHRYTPGLKSAILDQFARR
jgi:glycosyltransferase involved in cell wall biosynthesis